MRLARALAVSIWVLTSAAGVSAQTSSVLQGGFRLRDREHGQDAGMLSLGPLLVTGARTRATLTDGGTTLCGETVYVALGAKGTKRSPTKLLLRQQTDLVAFFVLYTCNQDIDPTCVLAASKPVAVPRCSALVKLAAGGVVSGKVAIRCKNGINASDAAFGLQAGHVATLASMFPSLGRRFAISFRDRNGEQVTGPDLDYKIRNVNLAALDDVVGTYLADDDLPPCL